MGSFKALCIAGIASLAAMSTAQAADLFLPPPPPVEPVYVPVDFSGGFYLRGDVGAGALQLRSGSSTFNPDIPYTNPDGTPTADGAPYGFGRGGASASEQAIVDFGAGYKFNNYFRADVTGEYRFGSTYRMSEGYAAGNNYSGGGDYYQGKISSGVFLVNGYVDLGTWYCITPYVGVGVGAAINTFSGVTDYNLSANGAAAGSSSSNTHTALAYAFMAGFTYNLTQNLKLDLGYRYLDMGRATTGAINCYGGTASCGDNSREVQSYHLASHDIRLGLRYMFADLPAPVPAQYPIVRKY